jgi:hypothetical protein
MTRARRWTSILVTTALVATGTMQTAQATVIGTEAVLPATAGESSEGRARLASALGRAEVVQILKERGVDPDAARTRVAALSDAEAARLADQIDQAPAGGINALAAVALVFVVLVITDILGFTRIFSFTSPIK